MDLIVILINKILCRTNEVRSFLVAFGISIAVGHALDNKSTKT